MTTTTSLSGRKVLVPLATVNGFTEDTVVLTTNVAGEQLISGDFDELTETTPLGDPDVSATQAAGTSPRRGRQGSTSGL